jgi:hypothetical protein
VDDEALLRAFEAAALTRAEWTHEAHVRTAWLYAARLPFEEALRRMRDGLRALNAAQGTPEGPMRGYHETLTQAWLRRVAAAVRASARDVDSRAFCERHPELLHRGCIDVHYSRERLFSPEAKRAFVEPDREPLPGEA